MTVPDVRLMPYMLELEQTCELALVQFQELEKQSQEWMHLFQAPGTQSRDDTRDTNMIERQGSLFGRLEAFLAMWARASLLPFPTIRNDDSRDYVSWRGEALREALGLAGDHHLANREFRDAWMHSDERLDRLVRSNVEYVRQRFVVSSQVTPEAKVNTLRLIEVDTLRFHFHKRDGTPGEIALHALAGALVEVLDRSRQAWGALRDIADAVDGAGPLPDDN